MINDRLKSNGAIKNEFRLPNFVRQICPNNTDNVNKEQSLFATLVKFVRFVRVSKIFGESNRKFTRNLRAFILFECF